KVTIRHGDRSAINIIPNARQSYWACQPYSPEVSRVWEGTSRYQVENVDGIPLERELMPLVLTEDQIGDSNFNFKENAGNMCANGQLTETGIRQHLTLGASMRKAYMDLLGGQLERDQVYVRSTDYPRTLQSAAAFLMAFLPDADRLTMVTDEDESREVMHGVGLRSSSKGESGEKEVEGMCQRAVDLSQQETSRFRVRSDVSNKLVDLFGEGVLAMKITEVADPVHSLSCHNMTLPCSDGGKGCMSPTLALSVLSEGNRDMCMRYMGAAGGMESGALAIYPFTSEILGNMKDALMGMSPVKFFLYSGHDTVIAPVLASLGAFNCEWPPYASHVAFELWAPKGGGGVVDLEGDRGDNDEGEGGEDVRRGGGGGTPSSPEAAAVHGPTSSIPSHSSPSSSGSASVNPP
ncbi:unnamed protein product, partial [Discosporangium mesarthrocarpum]